MFRDTYKTHAEAVAAADLAEAGGFSARVSTHADGYRVRVLFGSEEVPVIPTITDPGASLFDDPEALCAVEAF